MRISAFFLALALAHSAAGQNPPDFNLTQYVFYKSFDTAMYECAELFEISNCTLEGFRLNGYPDDPDDVLLVHCALVNLAAWNDDSGYVESELRYLFNPAVEDTCYENRTRECIKATVQPCDNNATAAWKVFQCYYRQYGNLNKSAQYVRNQPNEWQQLTLASITIVNPPRDEVVSYSQGCILDQPHFYELLYVLLLRGGYYRQSDGFQLDNLYAQFNNRELLTNETQQCITAQAVASQGLSHKEKVKAGYLKCLKNIIGVTDWIQVTAKAIVAVPAAPCLGSGAPPPPPPCGSSSTGAPPCVTTTTCSPPVTQSSTYNLPN